MIYFLAFRNPRTGECKIVERFYDRGTASQVKLLVDKVLVFTDRSNMLESFITQIDPTRETIFLPYKNEKAVTRIVVT